MASCKPLRRLPSTYDEADVGYIPSMYDHDRKTAAISIGNWAIDAKPETIRSRKRSEAMMKPPLRQVPPMYDMAYKGHAPAMCDVAHIGDLL